MKAEADTRALPERVSAALRWLHCSHVSVPAGEPAGEGARAVVDRTELDGSGGYVYPEITGYTLSVLENVIGLGRGTARDDALARQTALFLDGMLLRNGAALGPARSRDASRRRYTFDTGMALKGLAAHALRTGTRDPEVLRRGAAFVRASIQGDGQVRPFGTRSHASIEIRWSTRPGPYLLKAVLGMVCARYGLHGDFGERGAVERAVLHAAASRNGGRMFVVQPAGTVHMHAHLYACEAAYLLGEALGLPAATEAAYEGVDAALRLCIRCGWLPAFGHLEGVAAERSDTVAQLLRLCLLLDVGSAAEHRALSDRLAGYQHRESGALRFGTDYDCAAGSPQPRLAHLSTHATLFAMQAWLGMASANVVRQWREQPWTFA